MTIPENVPERLLHELRNRLNSLLMNAAVLRDRLPADERDSSFVRHLEEDGERCAALIHRLDEACRREDAPGG